MVLSNIIALQRLQNRASYIIENAKITDSWSRSWLNVENIIRYDRKIMTYKIMNKLCPEKFFNKFLPRSSVSKYNTRHCRDLKIPRYRTEFAKKGFHCSALKAWNDLPATLRELPTQNSFKKQLKKKFEGLDSEVKTRIPGRSALVYRVKFLFQINSYSVS